MVKGSIIFLPPLSPVLQNILNDFKEEGIFEIYEPVDENEIGQLVSAVSGALWLGSHAPTCLKMLQLKGLQFKMAYSEMIVVTSGDMIAKYLEGLKKAHAGDVINEQIALKTIQYKIKTFIKTTIEPNVIKKLKEQIIVVENKIESLYKEDTLFKSTHLEKRDLKSLISNIQKEKDEQESPIIDDSSTDAVDAPISNVNSLFEEEKKDIFDKKEEKIVIQEKLNIAAIDTELVNIKKKKLVHLVIKKEEKKGPVVLHVLQNFVKEKEKQEKLSALFKPQLTIKDKKKEIKELTLSKAPIIDFNLDAQEAQNPVDLAFSLDSRLEVKEKLGTLELTQDEDNSSKANLSLEKKELKNVEDLIVSPSETPLNIKDQLSLLQSDKEVKEKEKDNKEEEVVKSKEAFHLNSDEKKKISSHLDMEGELSRKKLSLGIEDYDDDKKNKQLILEEEEEENSDLDLEKEEEEKELPKKSYPLNIMLEGKARVLDENKIPFRPSPPFDVFEELAAPQEHSQKNNFDEEEDKFFDWDALPTSERTPPSSKKETEEESLALFSLSSLGFEQGLRLLYTHDDAKGHLQKLAHILLKEHRIICSFLIYHPKEKHFIDFWIGHIILPALSKKHPSKEPLINRWQDYRTKYMGEWTKAKTSLWVNEKEFFVPIFYKKKKVGLAVLQSKEGKTSLERKVIEALVQMSSGTLEELHKKIFQHNRFFWSKFFSDLRGESPW